VTATVTVPACGDSVVRMYVCVCVCVTATVTVPACGDSVSVCMYVCDGDGVWRQRGPRSTNLFHVGPVAMPASRHAPPLTPIEPPPPEHTTDDVAPTTQHAIDQVVLGGEYLHDVTTEVSLGEFVHGHADFLELFDFGGKVREMS